MLIATLSHKLVSARSSVNAGSCGPAGHDNATVSTRRPGEAEPCSSFQTGAQVPIPASPSAQNFVSQLTEDSCNPVCQLLGSADHSLTVQSGSWPAEAMRGSVGWAATHSTVPA